MNKKIIKIVIIIFAIIFILIGLENLIRGFAKVTEDIKGQIEIKKEEKEYENSYDNQLETYLDTSIKEVVGYLASGDFETIYNLLDPDYKDYMNFETSDKFKEYVTDYMGTPKNASLIKQYKKSNKYVCTVSITTENSIETYTILIKPLDNGKYTVILDDLTSIENVTDKYKLSSGKITYNIRYRVKKAGTIEYSIDITNNDSKTLKGSLEETNLKMSNSEEYYLVNKEEVSNVEIAPKETKRLKLKINNSAASIYKEMQLNMKFKLENGEEISDNIILEENYWE